MNYPEMYEKAHAAGIAAMNEKVPVPIIVQQHQNMADDSSPVQKSWYVPQGMCGFAWVTVRPGNCGFAKWLKSKGLGHKCYHGGWEYWVREGGKSIEKKEAYAEGFANVLNCFGIKACAGSRLD
jgi:hypothetical protein